MTKEEKKIVKKLYETACCIHSETYAFQKSKSGGPKMRIAMVRDQLMDAIGGVEKMLSAPTPPEQAGGKEGE